MEPATAPAANAVPSGTLVYAPRGRDNDRIIEIMAGTPSRGEEPGIRMNRYQKVVVVVAAVNLLLILLFPPFLDNPLRVGVPRSFDGFFPIVTAWGLRPLYRDLLNIEIIFVVANALAAWLALNGAREGAGQPVFERGLLIFAVADLGVVFLFPPFEHYSSLVRIVEPGFDSFYFVLGDKMHRNIFVPLLYIEVVLIIANLLSLWVLFGVVERSLSAEDEHLLAMAHQLSGKEVEELEHLMEAHLAIHRPDAGMTHSGRLGSGPDRRHGHDPAYTGAERRSGFDRRRTSRES